MELHDLGGLWEVAIGDGNQYHMMLPGTLDEGGIGEPQAPVPTRFVRKHSFTGQAKFTKKLHLPVPEGKRLFVEVERARCLRLFVNGKEAGHFNPQTLVTPHIFEVTGLLSGEDELVFLSDNGYPGLPAKDILYSSTATDETQTNWNGLLGYVRLCVQEPVFITSVRVYPLCGETDGRKEAGTALVETKPVGGETIAKGIYNPSSPEPVTTKLGKEEIKELTAGEKNFLPDRLVVHIALSSDRAWQGRLHIASDAIKEEAMVDARVSAGRAEFVAELPLAEDVRLWDEEEGEGYELSVWAEGLAPKTVRFGIRSFMGNGEGRLALNGRTIFLRGEANCAEFPESGHEPMDAGEWMAVLRMYQRYGVNCVRFHSHCPPEAAFYAADRLGLLMQPELSCWNPENAFLTDESFSYYRTELRELLLFLANHPSFVMLSFGNELQTDEKGHGRMRQMLKEAHAIDPTRLISDGSNNHYGGKGCEAEGDFYAAQSYCGMELRGIFANMEGYINREYPGAAKSYTDTMQKLRETYQKPVFGFEVGQFEVLPDFSELSCFCGVTAPGNLRMIQERVKQQGITQACWRRQVEATGELALLAYREEVEAVLRTETMSGLSLLGLQDFPGQGTALVGMMNSHLFPKPYDFARPERFREFFRAELPLVLLEKYTYENTETLRATVLVANYGKQEICGRLKYTLSHCGENAAHGKGEETFLVENEGEEELTCPCGTLTKVGELAIPLNAFLDAVKLELSVSIGKAVNRYPVWVYPADKVECPPGVYEARYFDAEARQVLKAGGIVYLAPDSTKESLPNSIKAQFTTDFWSVGTFAGQEGGMGQLIEENHPLFQNFPTEFYTNWQWWAMAGQRAVILPERIPCIVAELDSYAYLRPMAQVFECCCGNGRLFFSSLGLQNLQQYPECRALLRSIYTYLGSGDFAPKWRMEESVVAGLTAKGEDKVTNCGTHPE